MVVVVMVVVVVVVVRARRSEVVAVAAVAADSTKGLTSGARWPTSASAAALLPAPPTIMQQTYVPAR